MFHISKLIKMVTMMKLLALIERLESIFKARSKIHLVIIFLIFGVSGSASIFVSDIVLDFLNLEKFDVPQQVYWPLRLIVLFFCYQFILLAVSACFGELKHFSKYTKRIFFFLKN